MASLGDIDHFLNFISDVYSAYLFFVACTCFFGLFSAYIVLQIVRDSWISFLQKRFPDLEFDRSETLRSALDTQRNVGVVVAFLTIRGHCDIGILKRRLQDEIIDKRLPDGRLAYSRLRKTLTSRWGRYAWINGPFRIENHVTVGPIFYRGRPVTDINIQEYVNELVGKYLNTDCSPWHLTIIPASSDRYHLLLRVHHLLLTKESGMKLGDFLPITLEKRELRSTLSRLQWDPVHRPHPFRDLHKTPRALPTFYVQASQILCNRWNEFLSNYDPIENSLALKKSGILSTASAILIALIATIKTALFKFRFTTYEFKRRSITFKLLIISLWNSFGPIVVTSQMISMTFWTLKLAIFKLPILFICEFWAMCMINDEQFADRSLIKTIIDGWGAIQMSLRETLYFCKLIYNSPRVFIEEIFYKGALTPHYLQTVSRGGRKAVSWSQPVPIEIVNAIEEATGASKCDILLAATAAALKDFFLLHDQSAPDVLLATAQAISQEELLLRHNQSSPGKGRGIVCLAIPTKSAWETEKGPIAELHTIQQVVLRTRLRQPAIYLASALEIKYNIFTKCLPSHLVRLIANGLSRRFTVSITDVFQTASQSSRKHQLWYQEVETFMYWSPPQGNICLSLTLMAHGDSVIIGVMADSQLSPHHSIISSTFPGHIRRMATAAGVAIETRRPQVPSDDSDESGGNRTPNSLSSSSSMDSFDDECQIELLPIEEPPPSYSSL